MEKGLETAILAFIQNNPDWEADRVAKSFEVTIDYAQKLIKKAKKNKP